MVIKEYFLGIGKIKFEGKDSKNLMVFCYYDVEKMINGCSMKDWLKFVMVWWYIFCVEGGDQFGGGIKQFLWNGDFDFVQVVKNKMDVGFEFMQKMGIGYYCFYDVDLVMEVDSIEVYEVNLKELVVYVKQKQVEIGIKLLWGMVNVFSYVCYMNGVVINFDFDVVVCVVVQIKNVIDVIIELGGMNYVFWGGCEGYMLLLNIDQKCEKEYLVQMLIIVCDYGCVCGFKGIFLIELKFMELIKYQYDVDIEIVIGFLKVYGLN